METYVISGRLALEFRKFLNTRSDLKRMQTFRHLPPKPKIEVETIKHLVNERYLPGDRSVDEECNQRQIVRARHIAYYLIRQVMKLSLPQIALHFGSQHHTTVMYGLRMIREEINKDPLFSVEMSDLERELTA